jgi:hypothetical protein
MVPSLAFLETSGNEIEESFKLTDLLENPQVRSKIRKDLVAIFPRKLVRNQDERKKNNNQSVALLGPGPWLNFSKSVLTSIRLCSYKTPQRERKKAKDDFSFGPAPGHPNVFFLAESLRRIRPKNQRKKKSNSSPNQKCRKRCKVSDERRHAMSFWGQCRPNVETLSLEPVPG